MSYLFQVIILLSTIAGNVTEGNEHGHSVCPLMKHLVQVLATSLITTLPANAHHGRHGDGLRA